jgi:kinesin family member 15
MQYISEAKMLGYFCAVPDVLGLLDEGLKNRHIGETRMNRESSRSHCVLTCTLKSCTTIDGIATTLTSRINLVDLAGSEQQKSSGATGERMREASSINKSLSTLGRVINTLAQHRSARPQTPHVPYRDSKLTFLLQVFPVQLLCTIILLLLCLCTGRQVVWINQKCSLPSLQW